MSWRGFATPVLIAFLAQLLLVSWFYPIGQVLTARLPTHIDAPYHLYEIEVARQLCRDHRLVGYDPYFAAGYANGVPYNASAKLPALLACAFDDSRATPVMYKLTEFTLSAVALAAFLAGLLLSGASTGMATVATIFACLLWWTGAIRWYQTAGMFSFVGATFLAVPFAALLAKTCASPFLWRSAFAIGAIGGLCVILHPLFAVVAGALTIALLGGIVLDCRHARSVFGTLAIVCLVVVTINVPWVLP